MIVVWRVTQQCNLSCPFCLWDKTLWRKPAYIHAEAVLKFSRVLAAYQQTTRDHVLLSWLGGEPLLWPPLYEISMAIKKLGIAQSATTNGLNLTSQKIQTLVLANFSELTISVDGFAEFHDSMRGFPGIWRQIQTAVADLVKHRLRHSLKLRVNVVLMRDNLSMFEALCLALADWGIDEITFNVLGGRERPEFFPDHGLRPQDCEALAIFLPDLKTKLAAQGVKLCGNTDYLNRITASANRISLPVADCMPGKHFLFIDEFGKIAPCSFTVDDYQISINDIEDLVGLLNLNNAFRLNQREKLPSACNDCVSTQIFAKFSS